MEETKPNERDAFIATRTIFRDLKKNKIDLATARELIEKEYKKLGMRMIISYGPGYGQNQAGSVE